MSPAALGLALALSVAALDQASKAWALHALAGEGPRPLLPGLDLVLAHNPGISYSLLRADGLAGRLILIAIALAALTALAVWIARTPSRLAAAALGLIAGGTVGNVADRIRVGAVVDFLYFHTPVPLGPLSNYIFNVADVGITAGCALLLYESITTGRRTAET